jgi:hypothetical protein
VTTTALAHADARTSPTCPFAQIIALALLRALLRDDAAAERVAPT